MNFPRKIPVSRIEDYHTHYMGKASDGRQFWGYCTFAFEVPIWEYKGENWQRNRLEYLLLHTFDKNGAYLSTRYRLLGTTDQIDDAEVDRELETWVRELGEVEFTDVEIELFQIVIDGRIFGLVPNQEGESIDLEPCSTISFQEPWDGEYYT